MPARDGSGAGVKDVVLFPVRFRTKGPPGGSKQIRTDISPTTIRQVIKNKLAVDRITGRLQRTNCLEAFNQTISAGAVIGHVDEVNARGISPLEIFALVANLRLKSIWAGAVR